MNGDGDQLQESNDLINTFLQKVIGTAPDGWEAIVVDVDFSKPGVIDTKCNCKLGEETKSFPLIGSSAELIQIKALNSSEEKGSLKGLTVKIQKDGNFKIDYSY